MDRANLRNPGGRGGWAKKTETRGLTLVGEDQKIARNEPLLEKQFSVTRGAFKNYFLSISIGDSAYAREPISFGHSWRDPDPVAVGANGPDRRRGESVAGSSSVLCVFPRVTWLAGGAANGEAVGRCRSLVGGRIRYRCPRARHASS